MRCHARLLEAYSSSSRIARIVYMDTHGVFDTTSMWTTRETTHLEDALSSLQGSERERSGEEEVRERSVRSHSGLDRIEATSIGHAEQPFSSMTAVQTSHLWVGLRSLMMFDKVSLTA